MPVMKPHTAVYGPATLSASATSTLADCVATDLTKATQLVITFRGTFHSSATAGARVSLWPSYDGSVYDTEPWANWDGTAQEWAIAVSAGASVIRTSEPISPAPKYLKLKVTNLDGLYAITNCSLIVTTQNAG